MPDVSNARLREMLPQECDKCPNRAIDGSCSWICRAELEGSESMAVELLRLRQIIAESPSLDETDTVIVLPVGEWARCRALLEADHA